jgi:RimJ/RimL family protein N-acetyltransferase
MAPLNHTAYRANKSAALGERSDRASMRTIQTQRLRLVPVGEENAEALWDVLQEPDLRDFQDLPDLDVAQFRRTVAARPKRLQASVVGRFEWLVYCARSEARGAGQNEPLGWVSLRIAERTPRGAEIGYSVVRAHRGRGIATEAVAALVAEGFELAQLHQIRAYCVPENLASRAVLRRAGFRDEGVVRHGATVQGQAVDVVAHRIDRERWTSQRERQLESFGQTIVTPAS